jgi:hypothetical protein
MVVVERVEVGVCGGGVAGRNELYMGRGRGRKAEGGGGAGVGERVCGCVRHYSGEIMVGNDE